MKYYKSVLKKVDLINYKKGRTRLDEESGFYKACKVLYILSFAWFMLFHVIYLLSNLLVYAYHQNSIPNINVPLFITSCVVFVFMVAAFIFVKYKWQMFTFLLTLVGGVAQKVMVGRVDNLKLEIIEHSIIATKYFWRHHAPIILMIIFTACMLFVGISRRRYLKSDYENALNALYNEYSKENPEASDTEWTAHLEELDRIITEEENKEKENKRNKKRGKS